MQLTKDIAQGGELLRRRQPLPAQLPRPSCTPLVERIVSSRSPSATKWLVRICLSPFAITTATRPMQRRSGTWRTKGHRTCPVSKPERDRVVALWIKKQNLTDCDIGKKLDLSHSTIGIVRKRLEQTGEVNPSTKRRSLDGKDRDITANQQRAVSAPAARAAPESADEEADEGSRARAGDRPNTAGHGTSNGRASPGAVQPDPGRRSGIRSASVSDPGERRWNLRTFGHGRLLGLQLRGYGILFLA